MTLTFITNYLTHHTSPLSEALYGWLGAGFRFVETRPLRAGRVELGWQPEQDRPYLLRAYQGPEVAARCRHLALGSDVVLLGSAPDSWILPRLRQNRLTFRYGERWYKTGPPPGARARAWLHHGRFRRAPLYLLCASAYGASDAARAGCYPGRAYRFGYFPQVHFHCKGALLSQKDPTGSTLLWAGRFLSWKHPLTAIALARRLQEAALPFRLTLLGTGPERQAMEREIHRQHLEDQVQILGPQPPAAVRKEMEQANLFLLTSDFQEGWGAVLNEAMSSACAVISSHAAGAAPYLLRHRANGCLYQSGNLDDLTRQTLFLLTHPEEQRRMGAAAHDTMTQLWNPEAAAERLLTLCRCILAGNPHPKLYSDGPCSPAPILPDRWFP